MGEKSNMLKNTIHINSDDGKLLHVYCILRSFSYTQFAFFSRYRSTSISHGIWKKNATT